MLYQRADSTITQKQMQEYGYNYGLMQPISEAMAQKLYAANTAIYKLYSDNTESLVESATDITKHAQCDGMFGVELADIESYLSRTDPPQIPQNFVTIRSGSDGTNPWMDAMVYVDPADAPQAAQLCHKAMLDFFEDDAWPTYGDSIYDALLTSDIGVFFCEFADYDEYDEAAEAEWNDKVDQMCAVHPCAYHAYAIGVYAAAAAQREGA